MNAKKKCFLDTNILVYQFDRTDPVKRKLAEGLVKQLIREDSGVISSQVVQEFINVALKKFDTQIPISETHLIIDDLLLPLCTHLPSFDFYKRALNLFSSIRVSFYDALIIQAALDLKCDILYSEDLQDGRQFGKLEVVNPFKP